MPLTPDSLVRAPQAPFEDRRPAEYPPVGMPGPERPDRLGDQLLSDRLRHRVSPVVNPELGLHLLEVTTHGLFPDPEQLGDLLASSSQRHKAQDSQFSRGYGRPIPY